MQHEPFHYISFLHESERHGRNKTCTRCEKHIRKTKRKINKQKCRNITIVSLENEKWEEKRGFSFLKRFLLLCLLFLWKMTEKSRKKLAHMSKLVRLAYFGRRHHRLLLKKRSTSNRREMNAFDCCEGKSRVIKHMNGCCSHDDIETWSQSSDGIKCIWYSTTNPSDEARQQNLDYNRRHQRLSAPSSDHWKCLWELFNFDKRNANEKRWVISRCAESLKSTSPPFRFSVLRRCRQN